ncbi:MAG: heterocyst frequency control protein PatD [Aphanothece sp. CMT-3BRIN-NPC111]|jgi:hypothetical protein|nr:heterocyst frequency control protein PatD [Aphanothece sp. CMT-3BRIN-NPC111]
MLPPSHRHHYQEFLKALLQLLHTAQEAALNEDTSLNSSFGEVQQIFQRQILSLANDDSDSVLNSQIQPYLTEIHRLMRLLPMDITFLHASRHSATALARQVTLSDRIKTLIGFCEALLQNE